MYETVSSRWAVLCLSISLLVAGVPSIAAAEGFGDLLNFNVKVNGKDVNLKEQFGFDDPKKPSSSPSSNQHAASGQGTITTARTTNPSSGLFPPMQKRPFGPDIVGLQAGMNPDEIITAMKQKGYGDIEPYMFQRFRDLDVDFKFEEQVEHIKSRKGGRASEQLFVSFGPSRAGHESASLIKRSKSYAEGKQPTIGLLVSALTEKYGPYEGGPKKASLKSIYYWTYDSTGKRKSTGQVIDSGELDRCRFHHDKLGIRSKIKHLISKRKEIHPGCGAVTLKVVLEADRRSFSYDGSRKNPSEILVKHMTITIMAHDQRAASALEATEMVIQIKQDMAQKAVDRGNSRKPEL